MRQADAALVEHDQIARGHDRAEQVRELFGERDRCLARPARERDHRFARFPDRRAVAAHRQRDRPRRALARVQRHRQVPAGEIVAVAARRPCDLGLRGGRRPCASARCQERSGDGESLQSHSRNLADRDGGARRRASWSGRGRGRGVCRWDALVRAPGGRLSFSGGHACACARAFNVFSMSFRSVPSSFALDLSAR